MTPSQRAQLEQLMAAPMWLPAARKLAEEMLQQRVDTLQGCRQDQGSRTEPMTNKPTTSQREIHGDLYVGDGWSADYIMQNEGAGPGLPPLAGVHVFDAWIDDLPKFIDAYGADEVAKFGVDWADAAITEALA